MLQASCLVCSTPFPCPAVAGERVLRRGAAHAQGCDPSWRGSTGPGMHCSSVRPHCLFPSSFPIAGHTQGNRRHLLEGALVSAALGLLRFPQQAQHYPCACVCARRWASLPAELWQSKSGSHAETQPAVPPSGGRSTSSTQSLARDQKRKAATELGAGTGCSALREISHACRDEGGPL